MKRLVVVIMVLAAGLVSNKSFAQGNHLNFGVGLSNWGIPVYLTYDFQIANDWNIILGMSYQSDYENYHNDKWRHNIFGLRGGVQYYFDRVVNLDDNFDLYGALSLGYFFWNTSYYDGPNNSSPYYQDGRGGIGLGVAAGARWYFSPKWALNLEFGGGTVLSGALLGLSVKM